MKILIYSVNPQSPHLAVDIELASNLSAAGNNVTIARCTGQLRACVENPNHHILVCEACKSTYRKGLHAAGLGNIKVIAIPDRQSRYPQWPHPFMNIGDLKAFTYDGMDAGFSVASTLIGRFDKDHQFDAIAHQHEIIRELQMWLDVYEGMQTYLLQEKPDVVYFFNGRFSSIHPLQCLCIKLGIDYYTHERGGVMNRYILRKNATPHSISYAANELAELWENGPADKIQIGERFFTDRRNSVIQSWISFTDEQKKGMLPEGFDFSKRNIAIFNSTMEEYEGMKEWANPLYKDENEAIRAVLRSFLSKPEFVFYLRVHPNLKLLDNSQMREIYSMANEFPNLRLIRPESRFDSYALMEQSEKIITFGSTMGVEATYWGKTSVLLGKSLYMNMGACHQPASHEEAIEMLERPELPRLDRINAIKYGYWEIAKGIPFEVCQQKSLFDFHVNGTPLKPALGWMLLEKITKLTKLKNRRFLDDVRKKVKGWLS